MSSSFFVSAKPKALLYLPSKPKIVESVEFFRFVFLIKRICFGEFSAYPSVFIARVHSGLGVPENFEFTIIDR